LRYDGKLPTGAYLLEARNGTVKLAGTHSGRRQLCRTEASAKQALSISATP